MTLYANVAALISRLLKRKPPVKLPQSPVRGAGPELFFPPTISMQGRRDDEADPPSG